ncbi:signal recognition particle receptor FtsY [Dissulfurispira thermophila]|uniref:Signal recognition particle receptor FtsY n=2 Tax=root TaxID=1 RepID=A0A7G1H5Q5_9BACT|nr:signal recognition particle-docking protein FtsY [Dissulfurispira thermophila]BCB97452.1 signal recognition particle receptor FtsY [Dissulfurispira thermophila]
MGFLDKLKSSLTKTKKNIVERVESILLGRSIDESVIDDIEEVLITSDVGTEATNEIITLLREKIKVGEIKNSEDVRSYLKTEMALLLGKPQPLIPFGEKPFVILAVGVNGVGKTTTIGKLASRFISEGNSVILAAADTFRAAAIEQLEIWAKRSGADIIKHQSGSDPAAVAFDAVEAAKARGVDIVIIDTAGRLHTKSQLMDELKKINRVIKKSIPDAPQEILLIVDATTGQNALRQAQIFNEAIGITGIALTKLDGTAKGGIIFAIKKELGIPVRLIGVGEGVDDLKDFDPEDFVAALFDYNQ